MSNIYPMIQPLICFDVQNYQEFSGSVPFLFSTYEFDTMFDITHVRFIPNGCIDLLIPVSRSQIDETGKDYSNASSLILVGATDTLTKISLSKNTHYFCIRFAPGIFYWNQRTLPSELFKKILYCDNPRDYSPIIPKNLARFESIEKRTAYLMDNVLPCLKKTYLTPQVVHTIHYIIEMYGSIHTQELADKLSYSVRHTNRLFLNALGYGPKTFCRYVRIQNVLSEIKKMPGRGSKTFLQKVRYSDQAHFQREFKEFTGITPKQYIQLLR